ncbi:serine hydrolase domain-containing protein [Nocardia carnea]|uniref:serine hydrolase domain-containing protein n=1 Tax=Nocardia carnea TaxID=37328 RepID=UPI002458E0E7|nr:serine hydrolase domain-containing protein [Nocardia carnea]
MHGDELSCTRTRLGPLAAVLLLVSVIAGGCGTSDSAPPGGFPLAAATVVDRAVRAHMEAGLIPGVAVAIVDPDRGTFRQAYGLADIATGRPATVDDHYRIGSVTKTFTATAVLRLAEQGRLALDDRLEHFVPGVPNGGATTLRHLLGMRGGVYDYSRDPEFVEQQAPAEPTRVWSGRDVLRIIAAHPGEAKPPGRQGVYSNSEYYLLGMVLERVTGRPLRQVLGDLAAEYGLRATSFPGDGSLPDPAGRGYAYAADVAVDVTERTRPEVYGAAGAMVSTVADLALYAGALGRGELLQESTFRERTEFTEIALPAGGTVPYGLGLIENGHWLTHSGAVLGYSSQIGYLPDHDVGVVVVANQYTLPPEQLLISASNIWSAIVDDLYPGTRGAAVAESVVTPPVPTVASRRGRRPPSRRLADEYDEAGADRGTDAAISFVVDTSSCMHPASRARPPVRWSRRVRSLPVAGGRSHPTANGVV